ncbi:MAG: hypothetical protein GWN61_14020, partial [candidate division Zixibacteria bacterium]|nr:hypothetical protein [candidate division Zixibacteria bacterium]NIR65338.1 hypothetical protein [candidate division Zixibacteria bacterium]NIS47321.1 hypothetical protein [candidate division Zixibacteria bacterium]NIU15437.1 hypothetical protein [candidate division Zixibacteria bacterium]NIV07257.1 hypothetical protein [candidate division Zixibacteria bacterium]
VRTPGSDEQPDPQWRPVEEGDRKNVRRPGVLTDEEWDDPDIWYYWKRNIQREA